jgi:ribosomal protein L37AE/L43A
MPSVIERASSGRAKCRVCGQAISRAELRFGEALPNAYGEGESLFWFHLPCAACARPESLLPALAAATETVPERAQLEALAQAGLTQPRLCRILKAERASSGRARCRHCRELIAQGAWRLSLQMFEEGRFNPIGTIHVTCAVGYFGSEPPLARLSLPSNELGADELAEIAAQMREGAARALELPGLAKAPAPEAESESTRKSS